MSRRYSDEAVVRAYAKVARPQILRFFPRNSCVASTRTTIECLARFGLQGTGLACEFVVQGQKLAYVSGLRAGNEQAARAASGSFTYLRSADPFDLHVVAIIEQPQGLRWLIDASFDQARAVGLPVADEPFIVPLPRDVDPCYLAVDATVQITADVQATVHYRGRPERDFEATPAWETDHLQPVIRMICRRMERLL